ncbi:MAG TPA: hypothetical protein VFK30_11820, partial [Anaerolineae bacterium]|nr:hypothetical protein [Anaerolineae bacterium]
FAENVIHGVTGYRCRTFEQFIWAVANVGEIERAKCRAWAIENFSLERIGAMYEEYFDMLQRQHRSEHWYSKNPERKDLNWLTRYSGEPEVDYNVERLRLRR